MAAPAHREPGVAPLPAHAAGGAVAWRPVDDVTGGGANGGVAGRGAPVLGPGPASRRQAGGGGAAQRPGPGQPGLRGSSVTAPPAQPGRLFSGVVGGPGGTAARQAPAFVLRNPGPAGSGWRGGAGPEAGAAGQVRAVGVWD